MGFSEGACKELRVEQLHLFTECLRKRTFPKGVVPLAYPKNATLVSTRTYKEGL